jgi:hypothetical protein
VKSLKKHLSYANVISTLCLFLLLGGGAAIAAGLAKNSVGSKQLKKNAVVTAKIKKEAVTGGKVKKDTLTGTQINEGTLGAVPLASAIPAAQVHVVGGAGEPPFQSGSQNYGTLSGLANTPVLSFLKDQNNIVHLEGIVKPGKSGPVSGVLFQLPAGDRPPSGTIVVMQIPEEVTLLIAGSNVVVPGFDLSGLVIASTGKEAAILTGVSFFAGS